jgi:hypothetical protein
VEERPLRTETAEIFGLPAETVATQITRVLLMDGEPRAWMCDMVHPDVDLPSTTESERNSRRGRWCGTCR